MTVAYIQYSYHGILQYCFSSYCNIAIALMTVAAAKTACNRRSVRPLQIVTCSNTAPEPQGHGATRGHVATGARGTKNNLNYQEDIRRARVVGAGTPAAWFWKEPFALPKWFWTEPFALPKKKPTTAVAAADQALVIVADITVVAGNNRGTTWWVGGKRAGG